jgi:hypothetical protein
MSGCFVLINLPLRRQPKLEFLMTYVMVKYDTYGLCRTMHYARLGKCAFTAMDRLRPL